MGALRNVFAPIRNRPLFALAVVFTVFTSVACTYFPLEDAYVDASKPTQNFGSNANLRVDNSPLLTSYLKFDVRLAPADGSAFLRVFADTAGQDLSVYAVADNSWTEAGIVAQNAPPVGALLDTVGPILAGRYYSLDVSDHVNGAGVVSFALRGSSNTSISLSSREGQNLPQLQSPAPATPSPFTITRNGPTYTATGQGGTPVHTGTAKQVIETAIGDLEVYNGGSIVFSSGTFNFGSTHLELDNIKNIEFAGQGIGSTTLINNSNAATDTEVFDLVGADGVTIRDMSIAANGAFRTTSDAIDFDNGNNSTIERVKITASRGRGIVFDGKGAGWSADGNTIKDCVIDGVPSDGIEILAGSNNVIDGCTITNVGTHPTFGGHGIQLAKASNVADQPNKQPTNNLVVGNTIDEAGSDGININSGSDNELRSNTITNSSNVLLSRDGIRIQSGSSIPCDRNVVTVNTATDNQPTKTQRYGLNISSSVCTANIVGPGNVFTGNRVGAINDVGTNTQYL